MRRRDLLALGGTMLGAIVARSVVGQEGVSRRRAAVAIGVNRAVGLPVLRAAASGARFVAKWLETEGFETKLFIDDGVEVKASDVFNVIGNLVKRGTLDQLVVYFSGHGFISGQSEHWMLSGAPYNPNEAISLHESVALARNSGIPNVVFISDACRSTSGSLGIQRVHRNLIFPSTARSHSPPSYIDQFLATLVGEPAFEIPLKESVGQHEGIYTSCFIHAFKSPDEDMVRTIDGMPVVPNRNLRGYLEREVREERRRSHSSFARYPTRGSRATTRLTLHGQSLRNRCGPLSAERLPLRCWMSPARSWSVWE